METMTLNQLEEYLPIIEKTTIGTTIENKIKLILSIGLFAEREVTLARAAELAGKSIVEFIDILNLKKIPWLEYNEEHFKQDNLAINKFKNIENK